MCTALAMAAASLAIGTTSAYVDYDSGVKAAEAQNRYAYDNALAANDAARHNYAGTQRRMIEETAAATDEKLTLHQQARQSAAAHQVAAGEAGVAGLSVDSLLRDVYGTAARDRATINTNRDLTLGQLQREQSRFHAAAKDRIASVRQTRGPSRLKLGLGIAQAGLNAASSYRQFNSLKKS